MLVTKLGFLNYRGFHVQDLNIGRRLTVVLAGANGCGKSSALDALAHLVSALPMVLRGSSSFSAGNMLPHNIRTGAETAMIRLEFEYGREELSWVSTAQRDDGTVVVRPWVPTEWPEFAALVASLQEDPDAAVDLPVLSHFFGGSTRQPVRYPNFSALSGRFSAYIGSFDAEAAHFDALATWFEGEENLENQEKIRRSDLKYERPPLRAVRRAVLSFLTLLGQRHVKKLTVLRAHVEGPLSGVSGQLTVEKGGMTLLVHQLSDGERRLVLLVGDLARRMAILNPHLKEPLNGPGVVLADEIDLHLHPAWQRRVMPALRATFPNVQFIVTTHSPQVLASVPSESVVLMKDFAFLPSNLHTQGRDTNTLLETVFDVPERPPEVIQKFRRCYDLIDQDLNAARALYDELRRDLEGDDPELARVETLLDLAGV